MNMQTQIVPYFRTTDFEKAFLLHAAGCVLDQVEWDYNGEIGTFLFEDAEACEKTLAKHKKKELWLSSADVLLAYREVKNELFAR